MQPTGQAHIGYAFRPDRAVRYATNAYGSSPWTISQGVSVSDLTKYTGLYSQVAVDAGGSVHTTYYDSFLPALIYATNVSGTWTTHTVEAGTGDFYSAVATDSANRAHILTIDNTNHLHYTISPAVPGGTWPSPVALPDAGVTHSVQIAVDTDNHAHAAYFSGNDLRYATNASGSWTSVPAVIGLLGSTNSPVALAVDADKHAHVAWLDGSTNAIGYATNAANGTDWVAEKVADVAPAAAIVASITTDATSKLPTVDFFDRPSGVLSRAVRGRRRHLDRQHALHSDGRYLRRRHCHRRGRQRPRGLH